MKRLDLHKAAALAVTLSALLPACGFFGVQNDVSVKRVGVDLAFGAPSVSPQPSFSGPGAFPTIDIPTLPPPPDRTFTPPPAQELCPPTTDISADPEVVQRIEFDDKKPNDLIPLLEDEREAKVLNAYDSSFQGKRDMAGVNYMLLNNWALDPATQPDNPQGYFFTFSDDFNGVGITLFVSPGTEDEPTDTAGESEGGIYLKWIDIPNKDPLETGSVTYSFRSEAPYAKFIDFAISEGSTLERSISAVMSGAPSRGVIDDPTDLVGDQPIPGTQAVTMTTRSRIGPSEAVPVCADLGHAYQIAWEIDISGPVVQRLAGTFWFATQYGGWPIKSDYIMWGDGTLIEGAFSNNIMRLTAEKV